MNQLWSILAHTKMAIAQIQNLCSFFRFLLASNPDAGGICLSSCEPRMAALSHLWPFPTAQGRGGVRVLIILLLWIRRDLYEPRYLTGIVWQAKSVFRTRFA